MLAARITGYGIYTPPEAGPSLAVYDDMFLKEELFHDDTEDERRFLYTDTWGKSAALPIVQNLGDLPRKGDTETAGIYSGTAAGGTDSPG